MAAQETVSIEVVRPFYRNGTLLNAGSTVVDMPKAEAKGYVAAHKAKIIAAPVAPPPIAPAQAVEQPVVRSQTKKGEK